jgi:nicotinamidase-related amidase
VGLQTELCVDTTVRRACTLGYRITLVADGHSTLDNGVLTAAQIIAHHNATLANFGPQVALAKSSELVVA